MNKRMKSNVGMLALLVMGILLAGNLASAQSNSLQTGQNLSNQDVNKAIVSDKLVELESDVKQTSFWILNDYDVNPKEYTVRIVTQPKGGKAEITEDNVSIKYTPTNNQLKDKFQVEVCHLSGQCDQATISILQKASRVNRSNAIQY